MKVLIILVLIIVSGMILLSGSSVSFNASAQEGKKPKDEMILGPYAKLGGVKFSHVDHITKNRSIDGTKPIACIECHHTAQPASEAAKHPPQNTASPTDNTTSDTAEAGEKDQCSPRENVHRVS